MVLQAPTVEWRLPPTNSNFCNRATSPQSDRPAENVKKLTLKYEK
ncbi:hypothetical protein H4W29_004108 [Rhizobium viscosum]|uniref:Uncharacterized protein n=1 Tax=Rhizobium viscosum TaxID=1673 RepID=A0ABR9IUN5_RHIVS|nr:hypothetical protein [Rhizobium viscosum]